MALKIENEQDYYPIESMKCPDCGGDMVEFRKQNSRTDPISFVYQNNQWVAEKEHYHVVIYRRCVDCKKHIIRHSAKNVDETEQSRKYFEKIHDEYSRDWLDYDIEEPRLREQKKQHDQNRRDDDFQRKKIYRVKVLHDLRKVIYREMEEPHRYYGLIWSEWSSTFCYRDYRKITQIQKNPKALTSAQKEHLLTYVEKIFKILCLKLKKKKTIEQLTQITYEEWMYWSKEIAKNLKEDSETLANWKKLWVIPYDQLNRRQKKIWRNYTNSLWEFHYGQYNAESLKKAGY